MYNAFALLLLNTDDTMNHLHHWLLMAALAPLLLACGNNAGLAERSAGAAVTADTLFVLAFDNDHHAFGEGLSQKVHRTVKFPDDPTRVEKIDMYVRLRCPEPRCNAWDMFASIRVRDEQAGAWYEIGRYITPYGVDNHQMERGWRVDVTDFKALLSGEVQLESFVEVWGDDGWLVSVDFDVITGSPDYFYYAVAPVLQYADNSVSGVPYGEEHDFRMDREISIPDGAEQTVFRTIISGWGHATPADEGRRRCAEWCFRTHYVHVDQEPLFEHDMGPMGCDENPVQPQRGNWRPDRAGWCPGQEVPVRTDVLDAAWSGRTFAYEYALEPWVNDFQTTVDNPHAYYAITSYVVAKSNEPIDAPVVR